MARMVAIISIIMIIVSIATFIIETIPSIRNEQPVSLDNNTNQYQTLSSNSETGVFWIFFIIETICVAWFSLEFICRFLVAPSKFAFIKNGPNIIDVVSIIPYFIQLIGLNYQKKNNNVSGFSSTLTVLRIVRLVRVFRIFKLSRHFKV
jgi:potassium voltage-gated channel Shaker-related subfamily A protein